MSSSLSRFLSISALALALPMAAQATTISSASVFSITGFADPFRTTSDIDTAMDGTANAILGAAAEAVQNADGTSSVTANAGTNPFGGVSFASATAGFQQTAENATTGARDYTLDFDLTGLSTLLSVSRNYGTQDVNPFGADALAVRLDSLYTAASFQYTIQVNGIMVFEARADVLGQATFDRMTGTGQSFAFDNVVNFTPILAETMDPANSGLPFVEFSVADFSGSVNLGTLNPGEEFLIVSALTTRAFTIVGEGENSVGARSIDPISVSSLGITSVAAGGTPPLPPIPLPAGGVLLIAGLGGLAALRRRKAA